MRQVLAPRRAQLGPDKPPVVGAGVFADLGAIQKAHRVDKTFDPAMAPGDREREMHRWRRAVARTRSDLGAG